MVEHKHIKITNRILMFKVWVAHVSHVWSCNRGYTRDVRKVTWHDFICCIVFSISEHCARRKLRTFHFRLFGLLKQWISERHFRPVFGYSTRRASLADGVHCVRWYLFLHFDILWRPEDYPSVRHFPPDSRQANETHAVQGFCIYIVVELEDCWLFEQSFNLRRDCNFKIA